MKTLFITIALLACVIAGFSQQKSFLRVFGLDGSKIAWGQLLTTTDSSVVLAVGKTTQEIKYTDISLIKTKRSFGHTVFATGSITTTALFVTTHAMLSSSSSSTGYGHRGIDLSQPVGVTLAESLAVGVVVGTAAAALKRRPSFTINGHYKEWQTARVKLDKILEQAKR